VIARRPARDATRLRARDGPQARFFSAGAVPENAKAPNRSPGRGFLASIPLARGSDAVRSIRHAVDEHVDNVVGIYIN
jgi:dihydropteroate synthase